MNELKLFDITETKEYETLHDCVVDRNILRVASKNTYKVYTGKLKSNIKITSFPAEIDYLCMVKDDKGKPLVISFKTAYDLLKKGESYECEILEVNQCLENTEYKEKIINLFQLNKNISLEENISKKLMLICKMSEYVRENCTNKNGLTCDYARVMVTEFMNDYSYEIYMQYNIKLELVCKFLMKHEVYNSLETAIEVICTSEAIRLGGKEFKYYDKLPKYKFLSTFLTKGMTVNEIMRTFAKHKPKQIHLSKLEEFIKGKDVMIDYKDPNIPVMYVVVLGEK